MELRPLGSSGLKVSLIGLGCNNFGGRIDLEATRKVIDATLELGVNHLDTADIYGGGGKSEDFIGQCLGARRKDVVLATKFGKPMADNPTDRRGTRAYLRPPSKRASSGCAPTGSTSSTCTSPIPARRSRRRSGPARSWSSQARCAHWPPRTSRPARSATRSILPGGSASPASSRRRTSTACSPARSRTRSCRCWRPTGSASSPISRWRAAR